LNMRERILDAFKSIAFTKASTPRRWTELSEQSGISKRTVYRYFKSKEEIVCAVIRELMNPRSWRLIQ
jgi:hypothetical protein